jgi:hypothetical protein
LQAAVLQGGEEGSEAPTGEDYSLDYPELIECMLRFLYTGELLNDEQSLAVDAPDDEAEIKRAFATDLRKAEWNVSHYARMYAVGCKYDVPLIRKEATFLFKKYYKGTLWTEDVAMAMRVAFHTGSGMERGMQDALIDLLVERPIIVRDHACVQDAIEDSPGLAKRLVVAMASKAIDK